MINNTFGGGQMADQGKSTQGIPVLIGVIAALLSGQILKDYQIGYFPRVLITLIIAAVFWYVLRLVSNRNTDKGKE